MDIGEKSFVKDVDRFEGIRMINVHSTMVIDKQTIAK